MEQYALRDGTQVEIRPIRADDGDRLQASHARLSPESRYRRYLGSKPTLTAADARYLVDVDGCDHFALVATVPDEAAPSDEQIVAVTRFIRLPDDPETAEFAIVVGDDYQRQGLAGEMMRQLADAATARGVHRLHATMLSDNLAVHRLMASLAAGPLRERPMGEVSEVDIDLPGAPARTGERLAGVSRGEIAAPAIIAACAGS